MKPRLTILLVSLTTNAVLAGVLFHRQAATSAAQIASVTNSLTAMFPLRAKTTGPAAEVTIKKVAIRWSQLESDNYIDFIKRLRAFGVPEKTIQDIIVADVHKLYRPKMAALKPPPQTAKTNFWMERRWYNFTLGTTREQREQLAALQKEERELIKTLLGRDVYIQMAQDAGQKSSLFFGTIPEDKHEAVEDVQRRFEEEQEALRNPPDDFYGTDTIAAMKALRKERLEELGQLMTPEQLKDFEAQNSESASDMRDNLGYMSPTEDEFRKILDSKMELEKFETELNNANDEPLSPAQQQADLDKEKEVKGAIAQTLGPDRFREYIASSSYTYQNLLANGASMETVIKVADIKNQVEAATKQINDNKSLTDDERIQALKDVRTETMKNLAGLIGERSANAYPNVGGNWIRKIVPPEK